MIFIILYSFILIVVSFFFKTKYGYLLNINFYITFIWCVFAIVAIINPLGFREQQPLVHIYSLSFLFFFNFFCSLFKIQQVRMVPEVDSKRRQQCVKRRLFIAEFIAILVYLPLLLLSIQAFLSGNSDTIRMSIYYSESANFFNKTIPESVLCALQILSLYYYFKNRDKMYLLNAIFIMLIITITSTGRGALFRFIVLYFFLYKYYTGLRVNFSKLPIIIGLSVMLVVTIFVRSSNILKSLIVYYSGPFSFLDYILDYPKEYGLNVYHYGMIILSPITEPVMYVLKVLGITTEKIPSYWINLYVQDFIDIGDSTHIWEFNNNTTSIFPFLLDFGFCGIVIASLFLAFLSIKYYKSFINNSDFGAAFYLYIVNGLFMSIISYQTFMGVTPLVAYFTLYYITKKNILR